MNWSTVRSLATVLSKSYFRASRFGRRSLLSNPFILVSLDIALFVAPFALLSYVLPLIPPELMSLVRPLAVQSLIVLPVILTSAVILAGILFELGQGSGLASSEAVNWLPVSPGEYVVASSVSLEFIYSPLLFIGLGVTIPLALSIGMLSAVPFFILISALSLHLGSTDCRSVKIRNEPYLNNSLQEERKIRHHITHCTCRRPTSSGSNSL